MSRENARKQFVAGTSWEEAELALLAADASFRCYYRLQKSSGETAILMDAPPPKEDVCPFINITEILHLYGLQAPKILARDEVSGFLLLQDFGDARFTRVLQEKPDQELTLYKQAMDDLVALFKQRTLHPHAGVNPYGEAEYLRELGLFTEWWTPHHLAEKQSAFKEQYDAFWAKALRDVSLYTGTLVLRDYHADNLMQCADGSLGLLDYQDALMGDPAYDVVSLLEDARRDVSEVTVQASLQYYLEQTGQEETDFQLRYALLGAQRNLKILGIFMRLCLRDCKAHYLDYIPRVWAHLERDLTHPVLAPLRELMDAYIPESQRGVPTIEKAA